MAEPATTSSVLWTALIGTTVGLLFEPAKGWLVGTRTERAARRAIYRELAYVQGRLRRLLAMNRRYHENLAARRAALASKCPYPKTAEDLEQELSWIYVVVQFTKARVLHFYAHEGAAVLFQLREWPAIVAIEPALSQALRPLEPGHRESEAELRRRMMDATVALDAIQSAVQDQALIARKMAQALRRERNAEKRANRLRNAKRTLWGGRLGRFRLRCLRRYAGITRSIARKRTGQRLGRPV